MYTLKGKRIILTGAAGFIGSNLVKYLIDCNADIHIFIRPDTNLWRIREILPKINVYSVDITQRRSLEKVVKKIKPDIIYHLATSRLSVTTEDRLETLETNIKGTVNLLEATALHKYQRFVYTGGSLEYGAKKKSLCESDVLAPTTFYGATKAASTVLCQQFAHANKLPIVMLRLFSVYGYWEGPARLIPTAIMRTFDNKVMALTVPGYRRDLVFIEDVINALICAAQAENVSGEIINIGSGKQWSNEDVVKIIEVVSGKKIDVRVGEYPAHSSDTTHWVSDNQKAKQLLGWKPRYEIHSGMKKTIDWLSSHQKLYATSLQ